MNDSMQALGWTLVHFCWQAAAIALLYRILDLAFSRPRSSFRYALALAAMMSMFVAALVTFGYEELRLADASDALAASSLIAGRSVQNPGHSVLPAAISSSSVVRFDATIDFASGFGRFAPVSLVRLMPWIDAMWLAGVLILSLRTLGGWMLIRRLRLSALVEVPDSVGVTFDRLLRRMGIRRRVDLFICERISGPLAMGIFRSVILLPVSTITHLTPDQLEVVLAHELAHIRRGDYLWNMLQTVVETLFFFHPAVWWLGGQLRQQRELCCDDVALSCCADPVVYATALLRLEEQRGSQLHLAMALDGHGTASTLKARIIRILDGNQGAAPECRIELAPLSLAGVSVMMGLFLLPLPHVFADHAKHQLLAAATIYPGLRSHVADGAEVKCAPKAAFTLTEPPKAKPVQPVPPKAKSAPAVAAATALFPEVSAAPLAQPAPAIPAVAPATTPSARPRTTAMYLEIAQLHDMHIAMPAMAYSYAQAAAVAKSDYISEMHAAGYDADLDKLVAMKIHGATPEYARAMAQLGYGKPTADDLVSLKIFAVTPETVSKLRAAGIAPTSFRDLISYQIFKITPEFVERMKEAGFTSIPPGKLTALRARGITPEFAKAARQQYPHITVEQLIQLRIFHIDQAFIASAKSHGFNQLTIEKLVRLRISGLLDDGSQKSENK